MNQSWSGVAALKSVSRDAVAKAWKAQYFDVPRQSWVYNGQKIYEALMALSPRAGHKQIDAVIGNNSWTGTTCRRCFQSSSRAIQIGEHPYYESATVVLCRPCAKWLRDELTKVLK